MMFDPGNFLPAFLIYWLLFYNYLKFQLIFYNFF